MAGGTIFSSDFEYWLTGFSSTTSSAAVTAETVVVTLPSATYRANSAYRLTLSGGVTMSSTTAQASWAVRKTNVSGTTVLQWPRTPVLGSTLAADLFLSPRYLIVGGADVTTALCLTAAATSGTVTHAAAALFPRGLDVHYVGTASKWPNAVVLS